MARKGFIACCTFFSLVLLSSVLALEVSEQLAQELPQTNKIEIEQNPSKIDPIATTTNGKVRGYHSKETDLYIFKGVRFALPPVDSLRWKPPVTDFSWNEVVNTTQYPPSCWNVGNLLSLSNIKDSSEDCLFVNVWAPSSAFDGKKKLPVSVFIHGGGFSLGSTSREDFTPNPENFASKNQVVYVNFQYRLGQLGFIALEALEDEEKEKRKFVSNFGTLDQIAALEWVQKNIERFGGDPNQVTLSGQSAGAFSICTLIASPLTRGLFHRVIMQSGGCNYPFPSKEESYQKGDRFIKEIGCGDKMKDTKETMDCLRSQEPSQIMNTLKSRRGIMWFEGEDWFPVVDGVIIPDSPIKILREGRFDRSLNVLMGSNDDEATLFIFLGFPFYLDQLVFEEIMRNTFGFKLSYNILQRYKMFESNSPAIVANHILSDMWICSNVQVANVISQTLSGELYMYHFSKNPEAWAPFPFGTFGAYHGVELNYIYEGPHKATWPQMDKKVGLDMNNAWANFIKTGNPLSVTDKDSLPWPTFQESHKIWLFNDTQEITDEPSICDIWDRTLKPSGEIRLMPQMKEPFFSMLLNELLFHLITRYFFVTLALIFLFVASVIYFIFRLVKLLFKGSNNAKDKKE